MKLISWNLRGSVRDGKSVVAEQAAELLAAEPDLIAFQEMRRRRVPEWRAAFEAAAAAGGHPWYVVDNEERAAGKTNFAMVASRWPIAEIDDASEIDVPVAARVLAVDIDVDGHQLRLVNTHVLDGSSYKWGKIDHFEGLYRFLSETYHPGGPPRILCGDFNEPQSVRDDGHVITWGLQANGALGSGDPRWDAGVRSVLVDLRDFDLADVYAGQPAATHRADDWSWIARNGVGRRYDHIFASAALRPTTCGYVHKWREADLSDHSGVFAEFDWP